MAEPSVRDQVGLFRTLAASVSSMIGRFQLANQSGQTFAGKRDMFAALGYPRKLTATDYRDRYERNDVAARLVEALPKATWRSGGELIEDEDPEVVTAFEQAWDDLNKRLQIWSTLQKADILAGLGRYSILLLGAPGAMDTELDRLSPEGFIYLTPYSERDADLESVETAADNSRFGLPVYYAMNRLNSKLQGTSAALARRVHYTRVLHIAEGMLDDRVYGTPRLERCWNHLDDLDKVIGGGAEAFWKRADAGMQLDLDPTLKDMDDPAKAALREQLEAYEHGLKRILTTRGVNITPLTSPVADFKGPMEAIISLISAGSGIPQRILMGSERGELASSMDRDEWTQRVSDRRSGFAEPHVIRPLVDRLIELGVLPEPKNGYEVRWPEMKNLDEAARAIIAGQWADLNSKMGETVVTPAEIRDRVLDLEPLAEEDMADPVSEPSVTTASEWFRLPLQTRKLLVLKDRVKRTNGLRAMAAKGKDQPAGSKALTAAAGRFRREA